MLAWKKFYPLLFAIIMCSQTHSTTLKSSCGCKPSSCLHATITTYLCWVFCIQRGKRGICTIMLCQIKRCIPIMPQKLSCNPLISVLVCIHLISNFWLARLSFLQNAIFSYTLMWAVSTVIIGLSISFKGMQFLRMTRYQASNLTIFNYAFTPSLPQSFCWVVNKLQSCQLVGGLSLSTPLNYDLLLARKRNLHCSFRNDKIIFLWQKCSTWQRRFSTLVLFFNGLRGVRDIS